MPKCSSGDFPTCEHSHDERRKTLVLDQEQKADVLELASNLGQPQSKIEMFTKLYECNLYLFDCVVYFQKLEFYLCMSKKFPPFPHNKCTGKLKQISIKQIPLKFWMKFTNTIVNIFALFVQTYLEKL